MTRDDYCRVVIQYPSDTVSKWVGAFLLCQAKLLLDTGRTLLHVQPSKFCIYLLYRPPLVTTIAFLMPMIIFEVLNFLWTEIWRKIRLPIRLKVCRLSSIVNACNLRNPTSLFAYTCMMQNKHRAGD